MGIGTKTQFGTRQTADRKWVVVDVEGQTLGRACTTIASVLRGKTKTNYTQHDDVGDFVIVVNAGKVKLTGKKWSGKLYYKHSLFPGGLSTFTAEQMVQRHPDELIRRAVWGMLPKGPLGRKLYRKLKVYATAEHGQVAQQPQALTLPPERKPSKNKKTQKEAKA